MRCYAFADSLSAFAVPGLLSHREGQEETFCGQEDLLPVIRCQQAKPVLFTFEDPIPAQFADLC